MPAAADGLLSERRRLAAVSSVVNVVAHHVDDLIQIRAEELPGWLTELDVPAGWRTARLENSAVEPARIAVCGQQPDGGWDGCETISVFGFTGIPPEDVVRNNADCTLRDLDAVDVTIHVLNTPPLSGVTAVRSSGYFGTAGLWVWAQYSTYVAGSEEPGQGRLIQHAVFIESGCQAQLGGDISQLSDAIHQAFCTELGDPR